MESKTSSAQAGYDLADVKGASLADLIKCSICHCVPRDVVETSCGHTFCELCLDRWLKASPKRECPVDKVDLSAPGSVVPVHSLRRYIANLETSCPNGCGALIKLKDLEEHTKSKCPVIMESALVFPSLAELGGDEAKYEAYLRLYLQEGMVVEMVRDEDDFPGDEKVDHRFRGRVEKGDFGLFLRWDTRNGKQVLAVRWFKLAHVRRVMASDVEVRSDVERRKVMWAEVRHEEKLRKAISKGAKVVCKKSWQSAIQGDVGTVLQWNEKYPPVQVQWPILGRSVWVVWSILELAAPSPAELQLQRIESHPFSNIRKAKIKGSSVRLSEAPRVSIDDFDSEAEYVFWLKKVILERETIFRSRVDFDEVSEGDVGLLLEWNDEHPPVQVYWRKLGHPRWLHWRDLELWQATSTDAVFNISVESIKMDLQKEVEREDGMKKFAKPGAAVLARNPFLGIPQGAFGKLIRFNSKYPPVLVSWTVPGATAEVKAWCVWRDIMGADKLISKPKALTEQLVTDRDLMLSKKESWDHKALRAKNSESEYIDWLRGVLKPGMWVRAINGDGKVQAGDVGVYMKSNTSFPPVLVIWKELGASRWYYWRDLEPMEEPPGIATMAIVEKLVEHEEDTQEALVAKKGEPLSVVCVEGFQAVSQGALGELRSSTETYPPCCVYWPDLGRTHNVLWKSIRISESMSEAALKKLRRDTRPIPVASGKSDSFEVKTIADFDCESEYGAWFRSWYSEVDAANGVALVKANSNQDKVPVGEYGLVLQFNSSFPPAYIRFRNTSRARWFYWRDFDVVVEKSIEISKIAQEILNELQAESALVESLKAGDPVMLTTTTSNAACQGEIGRVVEADMRWAPAIRVLWQDGRASEIVGVDPKDIISVKDFSKEQIRKARHASRPPWAVSRGVDSEWNWAEDQRFVLRTDDPIRVLVRRDDIGIRERSIGLLRGECTGKTAAIWFADCGTIRMKWSDIEAHADLVLSEKKDLESEMARQEAVRMIVRPGYEVISTRAPIRNGRFLGTSSTWPPCVVEWEGEAGQLKRVAWSEIDLQAIKSGTFSRKHKFGKEVKSGADSSMTQ